MPMIRFRVVGPQVGFLASQFETRIGFSSATVNRPQPAANFSSTSRYQSKQSRLNLGTGRGVRQRTTSERRERGTRFPRRTAPPSECDRQLPHPVSLVSPSPGEFAVRDAGHTTCRSRTDTKALPFASEPLIASHRDSAIRSSAAAAERPLGDGVFRRNCHRFLRIPCIYRARFKLAST